MEPWGGIGVLSDHGTGSGSSGDEVPSASTWWIGVTIAMVGAFCGSMGDNLVKLSYNTLDRLSEDQRGERTPGRIGSAIWNFFFCCGCCSADISEMSGRQDLFNGQRCNLSPEAVTQLQYRGDVIFVCGWFCTIIINTSCTFGALAYAPASIVTPFAGVHLFWNIWLANWINHEPVAPRDYLASFLIVAGIVSVLLTGAKETPDYPLATLEKFFLGQPFIVCTCFCAVLLLILIYGIYQGPRSQRVCTAALAGLSGSYANPLFKTLVEILKDAFHGKPVFETWPSYAMIALTIVVAVAQLVFLNQGLARFDAYAIIPIYLALMGSLGTVVSAILYQDYLQFGWINYMGISIGIALVVAGIMLLNGRQVAGEQHKAESVDTATSPGPRGHNAHSSIQANDLLGEATDGVPPRSLQEHLLSGGNTHHSSQVAWIQRADGQWQSVPLPTHQYKTMAQSNGASYVQ